MSEHLVITIQHDANTSEEIREARRALADHVENLVESYITLDDAKLRPKAFLAFVADRIQDDLTN